MDGKVRVGAYRLVKPHSGTFFVGLLLEAIRRGTSVQFSAVQTDDATEEPGVVTFDVIVDGILTDPLEFDLIGSDNRWMRIQIPKTDNEPITFEVIEK